ncbi:MAG: hypothetical protein PCFJNLEI_01606 [Verrucomicrobiae bacterium]|nr:hypothetical protein [Verrucomicrobiae bacterium]
MHLRNFFVAVAFSLFTAAAVAQVDIEHRRTLTFQTGAAIYQSEETLGGFGYFWFNENHYPWTNTALRVIYAGVYVDSEFSYYVGGNTNTAIGLGAGGGVYLDGITPYVKGERLAQQTFDGDDVGGRVFINQTIPNPTPLPLNVRASYFITQFYYRDKSVTAPTFTVPTDFFVQTAQAELRFGGIEPGLLSKRGAELYIGLDANYRTGFEQFGPTVPTVVYGRHSEYQHVFGSLGARLPAGPVTIGARVCGGYGNDIDQLSAWKLGGNLVNIDPFAYTLHGYYLRELFTDRFLMSNLALSVPVHEKSNLALHFYGDWARARGVAPLAREYHNYIGVGTGVSFRLGRNLDMLVSYGYGLNAVRNGDRGGHEIALGVEKQF